MGKILEVVETEDQEVDHTMGIETLSNDLRNALLSHVHHMQKPFQQMNEEDQAIFNASFDKSCKHFVREAFDLIVSNDLPTIEASLDSITIKDSIKATLTLPRMTEFLDEIAEAVGTNVKVILVGANTMMNDGEAARVDLDEPPLMDDSDFGDANDPENASPEGDGED